MKQTCNEFNCKNHDCAFANTTKNENFGMKFTASSGRHLNFKVLRSIVNGSKYFSNDGLYDIFSGSINVFIAGSIELKTEKVFEWLKRCTGNTTSDVMNSMGIRRSLNDTSTKMDMIC
ncbi:hypothetical protein GJ496_001542 [Pomphorhynchus laevis]|nr:hypothetical protein GJ496_001542 [Pomphorhynchus laevis]